MINDKDELFLSKLGNILLEDEKFSDDFADNDEDLKLILATCQRRKEIELKKGEYSYRVTPNRTAVDLTPDRV